MTILEEIIIYKKLELARRKMEVKISDLEKNPRYESSSHSLARRLQEGKGTGIIAEFKRKSPSKGTINDTATVEEVTKAYTQAGADGLSVLTDEKFFGGSLTDLMAARENDIPVLRKDFIIDEYQVIESRSAGADVILLIAACLNPVEVKALAYFAKSLGLEVLLEIHNAEEMGHICDEVDMIGVNNRNLQTFDVDINRSIELADRIPAGKPLISESGIHTVETIRLLRSHGFSGFLVGEAFMKEKDPGAAFNKFVQQLKSDT